MSRGKEEKDDDGGGGERHGGREVSGIVYPIRWLGHAGRPKTSEAKFGPPLIIVIRLLFLVFLFFVSLSTCFTMKSTAFKRF